MPRRRVRSIKYQRRSKKISYRWRKYTVKKKFRRYRKKMIKSSAGYAKLSSNALRLHRSVVRNAYKTTIFRPLMDYSNIITTQGTRMITLTYTDFTTAGALGHYASDYLLADFMTFSDIASLNAKYRYWELKSLHVSIKFIGFNNHIKFQNQGVAAAETLISNSGPNEARQNHSLWLGYFRAPSDQAAAIAIDPDDATLTTQSTQRSELLTNFYYRRLGLVGNILNWHYYQPKASSGGPMTIPVLTNTSTFNSAFGASLPGNNRPHGFDICLMDRQAYSQGVGRTNRLELTFQLLGTISIKTTGQLRTDH